MVLFSSLISEDLQYMYLFSILCLFSLVLFNEEFIRNKSKLIKDSIIKRKNNYNYYHNNFFIIFDKIKERHQGRFKQTFEMFLFILKYCYIEIKQTYFVDHINKYKDVVYYHGGQKYILQFRVNAGPKMVYSITNKNGEDVTFKITPYMGPCENFHGMTYTPEDFNEDELCFETINGDLSFKSNEKITIEF